MYLLHILDNDAFEIIDSDFLHLYDINADDLIVLTDEQVDKYNLYGNKYTTFKDGDFVYAPTQPSAAHTWSGSEWIIDNAKQAELKAQMLTQFITNIDDKAASIYSVWTRFEQEYAQRESAAIVFKSSNYQGEVSRFIADFAEKAGIDNKTATDLILVQAEGLRKLLVELANQRMRKYELKKDGLTETEMQSIYDDIIKQMNNLAEAYQNG